MADNLSISITADTASLRAQLAQAQADVRAYGAEVRKLADTLRSAGADAKGGLQAELEAAAGKLGQATSAAASFRTELRADAAAHQEHAAGLKGINEALSGLTSPIRNTIGGLREMAEITGVAFVAEKLGDFVKEMAELGEKTENTAAALGISAEQYSLMSRAMQLVGGDAEMAARAMTILQTKLVEAVENPASKAREAFLAMGISLAEMKAGLTDIPGFLLRYADGFKGMGEGAARVAAFRDTAGRALKDLVPYLKDGADGIHRLNEETKNTGAPFSEDEVKRLAELGKEIHTLSQDFDGFGKAITLGLIDPIEQGVSKVSELIEQMTKLAATRDAVGILRLFDPGDFAAAAKVMAGWEGFKRYWDDTQEGLGHGRPSGTLPEGAASAELPPKPLPPTTQPGAGFGTRAQREGPPEPAAPEAKAAPPVDPTVELKALNLEIKKKVTDPLKETEAELDLEKTRAKGNETEIDRVERAKIDAARNAAKEEQAIREKYAKAAEARGPEKLANQELADQYRSGGGSTLKVEELTFDKQALEEQQRYQEQQAAREIRDLEAKRKVKDEEAQADLRSLERQQQLGQVTVAAAAAAEAQILANHKAATDAILADEERRAAVSENLAHEVANRKLEADQKYLDQKRDLEEKAQDEEIRRAHATDQSIAAGLAGALTGKESLGQAVQKLFQEQEKKLLEKGITQVLDASGIGKALGSGEDTLLGFLPGAPKTTAGPDRLAASAGAAAGQVTRLGDAAAASAGKLAPGQTAPASSAPAVNNVVNGETTQHSSIELTSQSSPAAPPQYAAAISAAAAQYNVPPAILANLLGAESGFKPNAEGPPVASRGGERARWLGQFMPAEARKYGVTDDESSVGGAAHYLSDLYAQKGSWAGALGAYSAQGPSLSGYAAEKNPYGPALVAAAKTADSGKAAAAPPEFYLGAMEAADHDAGYYARRYGNRGDLAGGPEPLNPDLSPADWPPRSPPEGSGTGFPSVADRHDEAAPAADFGTGFPSVADRHDETASTADFGNGFPAVADKIDDLKGSIDGLKASTDKAAAAKSASAPAAGGDQSGLGSLLGLVALGALAAPLFARRTTGSAASSSPGTVFSSGGVTTQTSGSVHPALVQTNPQPSAALGIAGAAIGGVAVLGALAKLLAPATGAGGSNDATGAAGAAGPGTFLIPGTDQPLAGNSATPSAGGGATASAISSLTGLAAAIGALDPAAKTATSAFSSLVSGLSSLLGSGGGGAGAGGGLGGIFSLLLTPFKLLGGLFAEQGAVVPSAERGLALGRIPSAQGGLSVADGKGGTWAVLHPNETVLPSPISQLVQDLAEENRMGKIISAQPQLGSFGLPPSRTGFAPPAAPAGPGRGDFAAAAGDTHNHYEGDTHNINVTAFDGHDVERLFMRNGQALARSLARQKRITNSSWSQP